MPLYSYRCESCAKDEDRISTIAARNEQVCACGTPLTRTYTLGGVIGDEISGGFVQEHFGHAPEVFYSKRAMAKRADQLGLQPFVRHLDGDKNTVRWV